jgi:hypothetical protein
MYDHHNEVEEMPDLGEWCYEHMVEKDGCVFCQFGEDQLILMFDCRVCGRDGAKTWGWHSPDGQELCVRCMAMGAIQLIRTHELVLI